VKNFDRAQGLYNAVGQSALQYGNKLVNDPRSTEADLKVAQAIGKNLERSAPVIAKASQIVSMHEAGRPVSGSDKDYLKWAIGFVGEALDEIYQLYRGSSNVK